MKKIVVLVLTGLFIAGLSVALTGCGKKEVPKEVKRKGLYLKLAVIDSTESEKISKEFSVEAAGIDYWIPDLSEGENATLIGPIPLDQQQEIAIYPEGFKKEKLTATFVANADMKKESDEDAITIEVFDDRCTVSGTPVTGSVQEFAL